MLYVTARHYFVGLDLGQRADPTALAVVERSFGARNYPAGPWEFHYAARHLQRWPLGTSYPAIVADVAGALGREPLGHAELVVDGTGVGRPVVDLFRQLVPPPQLQAVTITAGHALTFEEGYWHVPKKDLVGILQVLLQDRRLQVADVPERAVLLKELENFRVKVTAAANEVFEAWREGQHDDLVLALALACWRGRRTEGSAAGDEPAGLAGRGGYRHPGRR